MANLAASAVTVNAEYLGLGGNSKRGVFRELTLTLASMGTATNQIGATALGFEKILSSSPLIISDNTVMIVATPNYDGTLLLLKAAGTNAPADFTGTYKVTVFGYTS